MELSITAREDITIRDLLRLYENGHSVYRTSHPGNWRLYKLLLSELGIPNCIWDITCIHQDLNNRPTNQIVGGRKIELLDQIPDFPDSNIKHLTPYYRVKDSDMTLANFHVMPLKNLFGDKVITSQSKVLLEYKDELLKVFEVIQEHLPSKLRRYILPCGCMVLLDENLEACCDHGKSKIHRNDLATSAIETLVELTSLVWNPIGYKPKGGVLYSFELAAVSFYLWSLWKFGDKPIYQLSGPELIIYGTKPEFKEKISKVFKIIKRHLPELLPPRIDVQIVPATLFEFGYLENNEDADITNYTQHDMVKNGTRIKIMEEYLDVPFSEMKNLKIKQLL